MPECTGKIEVYVPDRGILAGMGPGEIRHSIYIPGHMKEIPENVQTYGETIHFPEAIYQYVIGWFDWDVTKLYSLSPAEEAERKKCSPQPGTH